MSLDDWDPAPTPEELGLDPRFTEFRPHQLEAVDLALENDEGFTPLCLPTGFGKSVVAITAAQASARRTIILTATRALQKQYMDEHASSGLVTISGRDNYDCPRTGLKCWVGALNGCTAEGDECTYQRARTVARQSRMVVTNYAYWLNTRRNGFQQPVIDGEPPSRPVEMLILDEAHQADLELARFLEVQVRHPDLRAAGIGDLPSQPLSVTSWVRFVHDNLYMLGEKVRDAVKRNMKFPGRLNLESLKLLTDLKTAFVAIAGMTDETWLVKEDSNSRGRIHTFECVWPGDYNTVLFKGVPKVILTSATLRPATMSLLGVPSDAYEFTEWGRVFPANHTPIYFIPTVSCNHHMDEEDIATWVARIDQIIESRQDRKGIVHTVSYKRAKELKKRSLFSRFMILNDKDDGLTTDQVADRFRHSEAPSVLVSPSFSTGHDFPHRECEWQIIAKVPFLDKSNPIVKARDERMSRYSAARVAQELIQTIGRATRTAKDRCEIFIVDSAFRGYMAYNKRLMPVWFSYQIVDSLPPLGQRCPENSKKTSVIPSLISTE